MNHPTPTPTTTISPSPQAAFSVCVYCGSRDGRSAHFTALAQQVGQWIGSHHGQLVYGGGKNGLMGTVARATREAGGRVLGIIPTALVDKEMANQDCDELIVVETMHQRKALMAEHSDAFLALPGGIGTFEELFEIWTWKQIGYHNKPIGLLNANGYYDSLLAFLQQCVQAGFMDEWQMTLLHSAPDAGELLPLLLNLAGSNAESNALLRENL